MGPDVSTLLPPDACSVLVHFADAQNQPDGAKFQHALTLSSDESFASSISNHRDARTAGLMRARTEKLAFLWKDTVPDSPDLVLSDEQVAFNLRTEYGLQPVPDGVLVGAAVTAVIVWYAWRQGRLLAGMKTALLCGVLAALGICPPALSDQYCGTPGDGGA